MDTMTFNYHNLNCTDEEQLAALDVEFNSYTGNTELKFLEQLSSFQINSGKRQERKRNDSRSKQKSAGSIDIGDVEDQQKILAKQFHTKSAMIIDTKVQSKTSLQCKFESSFSTMPSLSLESRTHAY